jgi:hypothetical protein
MEDGLDRRAEALVLDSCYAASLQVIWDLRRASEMVVASPGRMPSVGLPWQSVLAAVGATGTGLDVGHECLQQVDRPLVAVRTDGLVRVAESMSRLATAATGQMESFAPVLTGALSRAETWGSEGEMCSVRTLCAEIGADGGKIGRISRQLVADIDRCTEIGAGGGGVTMPLRAGLREMSDTVSVGGFNETTGWGEMSHAYRDRLKSLMHRTFDDRRHDGAAT